MALVRPAGTFVWQAPGIWLPTFVQADKRERRLSARLDRRGRRNQVRGYGRVGRGRKDGQGESQHRDTAVEASGKA